eukprot:431617-Rhodomonas_salina.1
MCYAATRNPGLSSHGTLQPSYAAAVSGMACVMSGTDPALRLVPDSEKSQWQQVERIKGQCRYGLLCGPTR